MGGTRIYRNFCNRDKVVRTSTLLIKENQTSQVKEFSTFLFVGSAGSGLPEIIPLSYTLATWGQCPGLSQPESPLGPSWGVGWGGSSG